MSAADEARACSMAFMTFAALRCKIDAARAAAAIRAHYSGAFLLAMICIAAADERYGIRAMPHDMPLRQYEHRH